MYYLQNLTDYLKDNIGPASRFEAYAEDGELFFDTAVGEFDDGFGLKYTAKFEISHGKLNAPALFALIAQWVRDNEPDRPAKGLEPPRFFTQPLQNKTHDTGIIVEFVEDYGYQENPEGKGAWNIGGQNCDLINTEGKVVDSPQLSELLIFDSVTQDEVLHGAGE